MRSESPGDGANLSEFLVELQRLFVDPPGAAIYFLLLLLFLQAGLLLDNGANTSLDAKPDRRYRTDLLIVIGIWLVILGGFIVAALTQQPNRLILPPIERAVSLATLVVLGLAFAKPGLTSRTVTSLSVASLAAIAVGYVLTAPNWVAVADTEVFNGTAYHQLWMLAGVIASVLLVGLYVARANQIDDVPLKLLFPLGAGTGFGLSLMAVGDAALDDPGLLRVGLFIAAAVVPIVVYRAGQAQLVEQVQQRIEAQERLLRARSAAPPPPAESRAPMDTQSAQLLRGLGMVLRSTTPADLPQSIVQTALELVRGDVTGLIRLKDASDQYVSFSHGYDKIHQRRVPSTTLNLGDQPSLRAAIAEQRFVELTSANNPEEISDFYARLNVEHNGPVYFQPMVRQQRIIGVLVVALPYAQRILTGPERELLRGFAIMASDLLAFSDEAQALAQTSEQRTLDALISGEADIAESLVEGDEVSQEGDTRAQHELQIAREQISELGRQVMSLKIKLDDERTRLMNLLNGTNEGMTISQRIQAINDEQQRLREERDELRHRLQEAETALSGAVGASDDRTVVNRLVDALQREKQALGIERDRLQQQLDELRLETSSSSGDVQQIVNRMIEERSRLEVERDNLSEQFINIQAELNNLGIEEGTTGLAQLLGDLYEERANLKERVDRILRERDALLNERKNLESTLEREAERDAQIEQLQSQIDQLATDRDAAMKQRDRLRSERDELDEKVDKVKEHRARLLAEVAGFEIELAEAHVEQARLRAQIQEIANFRSDLTAERDRLIAQVEALSLERDQLLARVEGNRERYEEMSEKGIGSLRQMIDDLTAERARLEHDLTDTRAQLLDAQKRLDRAQIRVMSDAAAPLPEEIGAVLASMAQELRTPITSIVGYLNLLLQESTGILQARQKNFLERMAANVDRLTAMIEDLIRLTLMDTGKYRLNREPVDVVRVIEDMITRTVIQFRERNLAINLQLSTDLPEISADKQAISEVIGHLLTNAYLVSPPGTEITISANQDRYRLNEEDEKLRRCIVVSVRDMGGGVAVEDVDQVFARRYRAENPLIAGLGDTGVGLAMAKALVEAHEGRLWLESQTGQGSTLWFVIPIEPIAEINVPVATGS